MVKFFKFIRHYWLPHFINKYILKLGITERGYDFILYCYRIITDPTTEPQSYQELMFEDKLDKEKRVESARAYFTMLVPYCDYDWRKK